MQRIFIESARARARTLSMARRTYEESAPVRSRPLRRADSTRVNARIWPDPGEISSRAAQAVLQALFFSGSVRGHRIGRVVDVPARVECVKGVPIILCQRQTIPNSSRQIWIRNEIAPERHGIDHSLRNCLFCGI